MLPMLRTNFPADATYGPLQTPDNLPRTPAFLTPTVTERMFFRSHALVSHFVLRVFDGMSKGARPRRQGRPASGGRRPDEIHDRQAGETIAYRRAYGQYVDEYLISLKEKTIMTAHRFQKVVGFIETELAAGSFPGAALMAAQHGQRLFARYWGTYCSPTQRANLLDDRVFHMLHSFSKGISATVIVLAHQKKLIDYDAPVHSYIPEYRGAWKDVTTIRHLLTHSAGIPNCLLAGVYTQEEWRKGIASCCAAPVEWKPGSRTEYHPFSGLFLAAEAVRRTMNMAPWEEICHEFLFAPLNAASLTFRVPSGPRIALVPQPADLPCPIDTAHFRGLGNPGAGCFGRLEDMIKVLELHLNQGMWKGQALIRKEEVEEMHRIQYEEQIAHAVASGSPRVHRPVGLGWMIKRDLKNDWHGLGQATSPRTFGHTGHDNVHGIGEPDQQMALAFVMTNSPNPSGANSTRIRNTVTNLVAEAIRE